jgi:cytosine/adenosine deaminase-related metal-dependent hydrolase
LLTTHLAESRDEMSMFRSATGALYEFLQSIGRDMSDCGKATPLELFVRRLGDTGLPYWLLVHLNELTSGDFDSLARLGMQLSIAHCPRSHEYFGHSPFQFQKLNAIGVNLCLGTDSLASNDDLSLFAEMRAFQEEFPGVGPEDILKTVTTNAARALRQQDVLGKIRPGFAADLIALPIQRSTSALQRIIEFDGSVDWMMIGGDVL